MARRSRLTPFARFFIVMLFVAPLAFIGASYYHGKDGIAEFKKLFGIEKSAEVTETETAASAPEPEPAEASETGELQAGTDEDALHPAHSELEEKIGKLEEENQELSDALDQMKEDLNNKDLEIKNLQQQIDSLKEAPRE